MKEKPTSLRQSQRTGGAQNSKKHLRLPTVQRPRGVCPAVPHPAALPVHVAVEEFKAVSQGDGVNPVGLPNLVQTAEVVEDVEEYAGLYGGDARFGGLELPDSLGLGEKAIQERVRVPILGAVREPWVADL